LINPGYLQSLREAGVAWGFFSGAPVAEALYALERRLGLSSPVLVAMGQAPDKPDPTGLFQVVERLQGQADSPADPLLPVIYAGDTVADLQTIQKAKALEPDRCWIGVGILPPHVQISPERQGDYTRVLEAAGAAIVLGNIEALTPALITELVSTQ
jgi:HAD superfamily phosphatase